MQVGTLAIQHLFEKDVLYRVPLYQRPYVWKEEEQWQPLWEDMRRLSEDLLLGKQPRSHFLGASVQDRPSVPPGQIETRLLIDGQQRLTTLQLLLRAFEDAVKLEDDSRYHKAIGNLIRNKHPLSTKDYEGFKIWPTNADRDDYQMVMESADRTALLKSFGVRSDAKSVGRNIPDGYLFFHDAISEWLAEDDGAEKDKKIPALYSAVRDNVRLVVIDLDEKDDAQLIFETLNARGTPLLSADLVKNSLLSEIQDNGGDAEKVYQKYWQAFDKDAPFWRAEIGRGHARRARIEIFLQHALTLLTGDDVSAAHLYAAYRDFALGEHAGSPEDRIQTIKKYGEIYREIVEGHESPRIKTFLDRLKVMDIGTAYPFLLKLFDVLGARADLLSEVLSDIESFLVRRMVCRLSTRGYNRLFVDLIAEIEGEPDQIPQRIRVSLLSRTAEFDRWPSNDEFKKAWINNPLYENLTRPRLRLILEAMEAALRGDFAETKDVPKNLTVEHVMPQTWQTNWPLPGEISEAEEMLRRSELIHTIGNLSLLNHRLNPAQSNKAWVVEGDPDGGKREALEDHSVLYLNKRLCEHDSWNEAKIIERSIALFENAKKIWTAPSAAN
ncbi:DUF262 domain-containing protein [Antarcticimicrobium luteum]|uniref:DUF262 domain-containing protein n=1 Tax=Antarcticimicrobium luteum TaxID=2547397 RepID=A0A4R5VDW5_9RHOB|nr:DUF262 domain-containing protein [Antarcticimicrobium luteum]TDK50357.1 DUF262 domain-containing protein [Antarcticimicrobium luteum]